MVNSACTISDTPGLSLAVKTTLDAELQTFSYFIIIDHAQYDTYDFSVNTAHIVRLLHHKQPILDAKRLPMHLAEQAVQPGPIMNFSL
jgi:hypothetical protein